MKKLTVVVMLVSASAFAQGKDGGKAAPEAAKAEAFVPPTLPPEGKRWVESHLGNWKSNEVAFTMGDQALKGKLTLKCEAASSGWATVCKGKMDFGKAMPPQEVTFMMGWDIGNARATMFEVSNVGEVHMHTGTWTDDKTISVTHEGKTAQGPMEKDVLTFQWTSPKELVVKGEGTQAGKAVWTFSATAKK